MPKEEQVNNAADELDAHVAEIIKWHFSPETGCPFWLDWAKEQNWNPLEEVSNFSDLCSKFPNFQDEWLRDLPPRCPKDATPRATISAPAQRRSR